MSLRGMNNQRHLLTFHIRLQEERFWIKEQKKSCFQTVFRHPTSPMSSHATFKQKCVCKCEACCSRGVGTVTEKPGWSRLFKPTSEWWFHSSLHHANKQLEAFGVLCEARGECCQSVGMTTKVLQGNPLTKVSLQRKKTHNDEGFILNISTCEVIEMCQINRQNHQQNLHTRRWGKSLKCVCVFHRNKS